jgi:glycosyltransferase involved in cell wall biosynthesis
LRPAALVASRANGIVHFPPEIDANPYTRLFYEALSRSGFELVPDAALSLGWLTRSRRRVRVLHFHWCPNDLYEQRGRRRWLQAPLSLLGIVRFVIRLQLARLLGYRIVWTVHEVLPHASISRRLDRIAGRALAGSSDLLVAHDRATARRAEEEFGHVASRVEVVPHGSYAGVYPPGRPRALVREELGISPDSFVFLAFGSLKPYKRIELLLESFESLELDATLVIAGSCQPRFGAIADAVLAAAARDSRIKVRLGLVPEEAVSELYQASDAAVFARSDGWTSGSLVLALSQGLPPIAARMPAYAALTAGGEAGWLFDPEDARSLRAAMEAAVADPALARVKGSTARRLAELLSWEEAARPVARLLGDHDSVIRAEPARAAAQ